MHIGISTFPTTYAISAVDLARAAEERGFDSLWTVEHTHIPASRKTPYPLGGDLPSIYWESYEPFTYLAQAAAVTTNLKIGTGICLVPEHHPISLAKRVASIDAISNGRFLFGVGGGWIAEELENHGVAYADRWRVLREYILAMQACWTQKGAEYHGSFINFDPVWVEPKPVSQPHPPVFIGATSTWAMQRIAEFAQGWYPVHIPEFDDRLALLSKECAKHGRDISDIDISLLTTITRAEQLQALQAKGVNRVVLSLPTLDTSESLRVLDGYADVVQWADELAR